jgi:hypothetical protein
MRDGLSHLRIFYVISVLFLLCFLAGCEFDREGDVVVVTTLPRWGVVNETSTTFSEEDNDLTSTTVFSGVSWVSTPGVGCECARWVCQTHSTTTEFEESSSTTTVSSTTTTCITVPDLDYVPRTKLFNLTIKGDRFKPRSVSAFLGDRLVVEVFSEQGLHKIRDTYSNRTFLLQPGDRVNLTFFAESEGDFVLTCNPFCEDPLEASISISKPVKRLC